MGSEVIKIANCSGYYGDRLSAAKEMVEGGPIDVLTGDYLAELTMTILFNQKLKRGDDKGYVGTFLKQLKDVAKTCKEEEIKIVTNAGGLNPKSMANEIQNILSELGLEMQVAYIDGDDLMPRMSDLQNSGEEFINIDKEISLKDSGYTTLTANAYLGAWGIKEALDRGAEIVVCPRVTDAAVVIGPAAWKFNWKRDDFDQLAGALAAGHIIECGCQATGGNYAFFEEVPSFENVGFPIAEIQPDGSFYITKHPGTGGLVSTGTVTAQLLYEISSPAYINPDVVAHFDTLKIEDVDKDRVFVSGCRGSSPPNKHKACINLAGGYRNGMDLILTGLDIEKKAQAFTDTLFNLVGGREQFDEVRTDLHRTDKENPNSNEEAMATLSLSVKSKDPDLVGRLFSAKIVELSLANYPGFFAQGGVKASGPVIVYWPALVESKHIKEVVHLNDEVFEITPTSELGLDDIYYQKEPVDILPCPEDELEKIAFGRIFGTRSGDKGGCANLGVWAKTDMAFSFLSYYLSVEKLKELLPDLSKFKIERYDLPNIKSLNFYIHGILEDGISSNNRKDGQAKSLGEYLRAKHIEVPKILKKEIKNG
ncbi:MAG: exopolyphosphatase [Gammaproteobacteria bacterium]|nr:exopolyphosphatase [Gammaproteobacteria bacterium]